MLSAVRSGDWLTFNTAVQIGEESFTQAVLSTSRSLKHISPIALARSELALGNIDTARMLMEKWAADSPSPAYGAVLPIRPVEAVSATAWATDPTTVKVSLPEVFEKREAGSNPTTLQMPALGIHRLENAELLRGSTVVTSSKELSLYEPAADPSQGFVAGNWDHLTGNEHERKFALLHANYERDQEIEKGILLSGRCDFNHYHFLIEYLPRLFLTDGLVDPDVPLIVTDDLNDTGVEALRLLAPNREIISISRTSRVRVATLHIPSMHTDLPDSTELAWIDGCRHSPALLLQMRDRLWDLVEGDASLPKRVYLRRPSGARTVENTDAVDRLATKHGFETVDPASLTFPEQVALFRNASCLLGVGGAAWANTIFCSPGAVVISLVARQLHDFAMHNTVASVAGARMVCVLGDSTVDEDSVRHRRDYLHSPFKVDPDVLDRALTVLAD